MPWPVFSWNSSTGTFPTFVGWGSSAGTNVNPGVGLRPGGSATLDTKAFVNLAQQGEKGQLPSGVQSDYDSAKRKLSYDIKPFPWFSASVVLVILYFILKRK